MKNEKEVNPLSSGTEEVSMQGTYTRRQVVNKAEKKEAATLFTESARLEHLRKLGKSRSEEEQREFSRLYQKSRRRDRRGEEFPYDAFKTAQEFWEANRLTLTKKQLEELLGAQERVLDQEWWMQHGFEVDLNDENEFVGLEEGLQDLDAFIAAHGLIHDHPIAYHSELFRTHTPNFAAWCPRDLNDPIHGRVPAFFKQKEVFDALCTEENKATESCARYGIKTALSAWEVLLFKKKVANHATGADEHGLMIGPRKWEVPGCWLCGWEKAQKKRSLPMPEGHQPQALVVPPPIKA